MASVINSARQSTASVFDFVGNVASASNQLVATAARSIDMLDAKAATMHKRVSINAAAQLATIEEEEILKAARDHSEFLADINKTCYSDPEKKPFFDAAEKLIREALAQK